MTGSRYVVGIDLGTTNTALAYYDREQEERAVFMIPQTISPGDVQERETLPSFMYLATEGEFQEGDFDLPWAKKRDFMIGFGAQKRGAESPFRLVSSAKSWLCYGGVDRKSAILPAGSPEARKVSPHAASLFYLEHLREAWNHKQDQPLEAQEIFITVPASFDEVAKDLTAQAAAAAGLEKVTLLEEPQAAFYAWLSQQGDEWRQKLRPQDRVLVIDVGGGTTDLSLIEVTDDGQGNLSLERVAVGDHILLGGDNMDLALAHALRTRLANKKTTLDAAQYRALVFQVREAKEQLLLDQERKAVPITLLGRGAKLIGNKIKTELSQEDIKMVLFDGFFPEAKRSEHPQERVQVGFQEIGLPYAQDAAITRHLAAFLAANSEDQPPTHVLFNGGVFNSQALRNQLLKVLSSWFEKPPLVLEEENNNLAVARGAAFYGQTKRDGGVRIRAGAARAYYLGIESNAPAVPGMPPPIRALCVVPFGMEEGTRRDVPGSEFGMVVGQAVDFRFLTSSERKDDVLGTVLDEFTWPQTLEELAPLSMTVAAEGLEPGSVVPVKLEAHLTELGTLELSSWYQGKQFRLGFNIREKDS